jgi:hypothetical protein
MVYGRKDYFFPLLLHFSLFWEFVRLFVEELHVPHSVPHLLVRGEVFGQAPIAVPEIRLESDLHLPCVD